MMQQGPQVLDPAVPVQIGHAEDGPGKHGVEVGGQGEEILSRGNEGLQSIRLRQVDPTGEARQDHPQAEDIGERVVVFEQMFPRHVAGQVDWTNDLRVAIADGKIDELVASFVDVDGTTLLANDFDGGSSGGLHASYCGRVAAGLCPLRFLEPDAGRFHV